MIQIITESLILGLTVGTYCALSCTPFLLPYLLSTEKGKVSDHILVFIQFLSGRLIAYIIFGILASILGRSVGSEIPQTAKGVFLIVSAIILIIFSIRRSYKNIHLCTGRVSMKWFYGYPFLTGLFLGFNLCPPFVIAAFKAFELANVFYGVLYFIFLFIGTTVYLIPLPFITNLLKAENISRIGLYLGFLIGVWFLIQGVLIIL